MEYTVNKLARLSGVSARTLRYYDQIGLLPPARVASNGYRIYGQSEVDRLQQILFYREMAVPLEQIRAWLSAPDYQPEAALTAHLSALLREKNRLDLLISNVTQTISSLKGDIIMNDTQKFEGFKRELIADNENAYGAEIRVRYGDATVDTCNQKLSGMSESQWQHVQQLSEQLNTALRQAAALGDPASALAQQVCDLHRQWLQCYWTEEMYSEQAHLALAQAYCDDPRFHAYYENIAPNAAEFLRDALQIFISAVN